MTHILQTKFNMVWFINLDSFLPIVFMSCSVCVEDACAQQGVHVCPSCEFRSCISCISRWALQEQTARCMACKRNLQRSELPKTFWMKLSQSTSEADWTRECALMPATSSSIEIKDRCSASLRECRSEQRRLRSMRAILMKHIRKLKRDEHAIQKEMRSSILCSICARSCYGLHCSVCNVDHCEKCHLVHAGDCQQADVDTARQIKDCQRCPGCTSLVHKSGGCDHMTCTVCKTEFSWATGTFRTFRNVFPELCGGLPNAADMWEMCSDHYFWLHYDLTFRLRHDIIPRMETLPQGPGANRDLRIRYIRKTITKRRLLSTIRLRRTLAEKKRTRLEMLKTFVLASEDVFQRFPGDPHTCIVPELKELARIYAEQLQSPCFRNNKHLVNAVLRQVFIIHDT